MLFEHLDKKQTISCCVGFLNMQLAGDFLPGRLLRNQTIKLTNLLTRWNFPVFYLVII